LSAQKLIHILRHLSRGVRRPKCLLAAAELPISSRRTSTSEEHMRDEIKQIATEIKQSLELLRRHL
jgi:hypothetical protein